MTNTPEQAQNVRISKGPSKLFTEQYLSLMFILIAAFAASAFFLLRPIIIGIKETNAATQSELSHLDAQRTYLESLNQSVAAAQAIPSQMLDRVNQALPNDVGSPAMLMQFSAAAARNSVQISSIGFNPDVRPPTPGRAATTTESQAINIEMLLKGRSYLDVKRFLADIEQSLRLMDVTSISSNSGGGTGASTYQIQIRTYTFKPTATIRP